MEICQIDVKGTWHVFDEVYVDHMKGDLVAQECTKRFWWSNKDKKFVIDTAAAAQTGVTETHEDIWRKTTGANIMHQKVNIMPGTVRLASMFRQGMDGAAKLTIDPKCRGLIAELGGGLDPLSGQARVYSWMKNAQGEVVGKTPHDRYNDAIKALTYLLVGVLGWADERSERKQITVKRRRDLAA